MALQPPSYFQAPSTSSKQQPKDDKEQSLAQEPLTSRHVLPTSPCLSNSGLQLHLAGHQAAAMLTNDLLAVETHLQSRLRLLEEEKKNLIDRIVELEKSLVQQKEEGRAQIETLTTQHNQSLLQAQLEVKQLSAECHRSREEGERRAAELERELRSREQLYSKERNSLTAKVREQEACVQALTEELEEVRQSSESEPNQLREQLTAATVQLQRQRTDLEEQLKTLSDELRQSHQHTSELESYLGGEIPQLPAEEDGRSLTWKEERENFQRNIAALEHDLHKLQSEDKLLNIRLTSLMEILTIQESTIAKEGFASVSRGSGTGEKDAESAAALKTLLSQWREKVFVMLVQQKLLQIQDSRTKHEASRKEAEFSEWIQRLEREKELYSHSLADRNAELQLQMKKTNLAEQRLDESLQATHLLQCQVQAQKEQLCYIVGGIQSVSKAQGSCTTAFNQAMTRLASCEHRLNMMSSKVNSMKAILNYQRAVQQKIVSVTCVDCSVQTEKGDGESDGSQDLTSLSRAELISEVCSLSRERNSLVRQLQESTVTFEQRLNEISNTCSIKLANAEAQLICVQGENHSLNEQLSQLKSESIVLTEKEEELKLQVEELEGELREARTTMETRVDTAIREQQQKSNETMAEMEKLLSIARREHGKAVVQLQQLQRQLGRDRDRAMEAMTLNQTRLEQQLEACRKKLEASQVERNLLLTALRQEGIAAPMKQRVSPRRRESSGANDKEEEPQEEGPNSSQSEGSQDCDGYSKNSSFREESHPPTSVLQQTELRPDTQSQDIREVLKDLQMLSASLLRMETSQAQTVTDVQSRTYT